LSRIRRDATGTRIEEQPIPRSIPLLRYYAVARVFAQCDARPGDFLELADGERALLAGSVDKAEVLLRSRDGPMVFYRRPDAPKGPRPVPRALLERLLMDDGGFPTEKDDAELPVACDIAIAKAAASRAGLDAGAALALLRGVLAGGRVELMF